MYESNEKRKQQKQFLPAYRAAERSESQLYVWLNRLVFTWTQPARKAILKSCGLKEGIPALCIFTQAPIESDKWISVSAKSMHYSLIALFTLILKKRVRLCCVWIYSKDKVIQFILYKMQRGRHCALAHFVSF